MYAEQIEHLKHRVEDLASDKQRTGHLEADMKQARSAHDKALAQAQQAHQQQLEETLAANHKAQKEAKSAHEQAVEVGQLEHCSSCGAVLLLE